MSCRVVIPSLLSVALCSGGCTSNNAPDARVPTSQLPDADAPEGPADTADAPAQVPDAAPEGDEPDAPVSAPDAPVVGSPDATVPPPEPDASTQPSGPAQLLLNELSPDFPDKHDLVELLVAKGGATAGIKLESDNPRAQSLLATLPDVAVATGDRIIVHLSPAGTTAAAETKSVAEHKSAANFDTAWDFLGEAIDLPYSNVVVSIRGADGKLQSAVPYFRSDLTQTDQQPRNFPADLQSIIDGGFWKETCAPAPCSYSSNLAAVTVSWVGAGTTTEANARAGASISRKAGGVNDQKKSDWQPLPTTAPYNTYGEPN